MIYNFPGKYIDTDDLLGFEPVGTPAPKGVIEKIENKIEALGRVTEGWNAKKGLAQLPLLEVNETETRCFIDAVLMDIAAVTGCKMTMVCYICGVFLILLGKWLQERDLPELYCRLRFFAWGAENRVL